MWYFSLCYLGNGSSSKRKRGRPSIREHFEESLNNDEDDDETSQISQAVFLLQLDDTTSGKTTISDDEDLTEDEIDSQDKR